jgi:hypothetical protein
MDPSHLCERELAPMNHSPGSWRFQFCTDTLCAMNCGASKPPLALKRPSSNWLRQSAAQVIPKTTAVLQAVLPQFEGSPLVQSLILSLMLLTSGSALNLLRFSLSILIPGGFRASREISAFASSHNGCPAK